MRSWLHRSVCTRVLVKNVLSHYCKLRDYHYPPGFHHVVSVVLYSLKWGMLVTLQIAAVAADLQWILALYLSSEVPLAPWGKNPQKMLAARSLHLIMFVGEGGVGSGEEEGSSTLCAHITVHVARCVVSLGSQAVHVEESIWGKEPDDKNSVGLLRQPVWRRARVAPLPLRLCACLSHFVWRKISGNERAYRRWAHGHDRTTVTGRLIPNSIRENALLRPGLLCLKREMWMRCESRVHKKTLCFQVWLRPELCQCGDLNFCLHIQIWRKILKFFWCYSRIWSKVQLKQLLNELAQKSNLNCFSDKTSDLHMDVIGKTVKSIFSLILTFYGSNDEATNGGNNRQINLIVKINNGLFTCPLQKRRVVFERVTDNFFFHQKY